MPSYIQGEVEIIPSEWLTPLCPVGVNEAGALVNEPCDADNIRGRSAFFFQFFSTFLIVSVYLLVKNENTTPKKDDGLLCAILIALAVLSQMAMSENQGGACFNPAVALG